jgi:phosphoglycerate dehydrogenase-like enzyme
VQTTEEKEVDKPTIYVHRLGAWYTRYMDDDNEARLHAFADVVSGGTREEPISPGLLARDMQGATGILSLNGIGATEITTEVLKQVGTVRVAVVSHWWHGMHDQARQMWEAAGVEVIDASDGNSEAVAEWTIASTLMGVRRLLEFDHRLKAGSPWGEPRREVGLLCESVVGLIGLGRVGRHVARLLRAFGATVIGYDPYIPQEVAQELCVRLVTLEELMRTADVVSFHLPVTDKTRGMFGARELAWIRDGAVVVNSARAALFDGTAFVAEVQKRRFTAFLDVFAAEPLPLDHPFRTLDNVFITPHIAGDNGAMFRRCGRIAIEALKARLAG